MQFDPGQLVATPGALNHLALHDSSPLVLIRRHLQGDWGELCASDRKLNDDAVTGGERILSAYTIAGLKIYVITEWDRSYTTVLLASEY
jgi:hypothetical protein